MATRRISPGQQRASVTYTSRYPKWKVEMFRHRNDNTCSCRLAIPGVLPDKTNPMCPVHGSKS